MRNPASTAVTSLLAGLCLLLAAGVARAAEEPGPGEVAHLLDRVLPKAQRLELRYLLHLGWRFERDATVREVVVDGGKPCAFATLGEAHAAGALRVRVPSRFGPAEARAFGPQLHVIADGIASRCAYQHKLQPALVRAVERFEAIEAAGKYEFPKLFEIVNSPFWGLRLPESSWTAVDGVYVAYGSSARALEAIWTRGGVAECYTGQWLAIFGAQYELYGPRWFEQVFPPDHLQIGKPSKIKPSPIGKATVGKARYDYRSLVITPPGHGKDAFVTLAPHGPMAYVGAAGIMRNTNPEGGQMNENFTVVEISQAAVDQLAKGGGRRWLRAQTAEIWKILNASMPGRPWHKLRLVTPQPSGAEGARIDRILAQPAFAEVTVYVHPFGRVTFAELVRKKFTEDETHPEFLLYRHGRESLLYRRYHRAWKARCARTGICR